jgi:hypothetical protein
MTWYFGPHHGHKRPEYGPHIEYLIHSRSRMWILHPRKPTVNQQMELKYR